MNQSSLSLQSKPITTFTPALHPKILPIRLLYSPNTNPNKPAPQKSLASYPKSYKFGGYSLNRPNKQYRLSKDSFKTLKTQNNLTKLSFSFDLKPHFPNTLLFSHLNHIRSLSSISFRFYCAKNLDPKPLQFLITNLPHLKNLAHLDLAFYFFDSIDPILLQKLLHRLEKLKKLTELSLGFFFFRQFPNSNFKILSENLIKLPLLQTLKLGFDNSFGFDHHAVDILASLVSKFSLLKEIDLAFPGLETFQAPSLIQTFTSFQGLKNLSDLTLSLQNSSLAPNEDVQSQKDVFDFLDCLNLRRLSLSLFININDKSLKKLSQNLKKSLLLRELYVDFSGCEVTTDEGMAFFCEAVAELHSLFSLELWIDFARNKSKRIIEKIAQMLKSLQNLLHLRLQFEGQIFVITSKNDPIKQLFTNIKLLKSLKSLNISLYDNKAITDSALKALGQALNELISLQNLSLDFSSCSLVSNKGVKEITNGIKNCVNLSKLDLKFGKNEKIDDEVIDNVQDMLKSLFGLESFEFKFLGCPKMANFSGLFKTLSQMKNIREVRFFLPKSERGLQAAEDLNKTKTVGAGWF